MSSEAAPPQDDNLHLCKTCGHAKARSLFRVDSATQCKGCKHMTQKVRRMVKKVLTNFVDHDVQALQAMLDTATASAVTTPLHHA